MHKKWLINSIDVETAFLQDKELERKIFSMNAKAGRSQQKMASQQIYILLSWKMPHTIGI